MNEDSARAVTLLQAFETAQPAPASWSDDDKRWATRLAIQDATTGAEAFLARRADHAMQRLGAREPAAAAWLARRFWRWSWLAWSALAGLIAGLLADSIGSSQRINLLAPPLWGVLAWNAVVYLLLLGHALAALARRRPGPGAIGRVVRLVRAVKRALADREPRWPSASSSETAGDAAAWRGYIDLWSRRSAALYAARAATLLHVAAAALALGLIGGMYLRGLVLDYRAAWESTFIGAGAAHAALAVVLAPAVALSDIALPDAAAFESLRVAHGSVDAGVSAAPWIHLLALTLLLFVVLPRSLLAMVGALRARWFAQRMPMPLGDPYFQQLARRHSGDIARVVVVPYASTPSAPAALGLQALLVQALGDGLQLRILPTAAFGTEDEAPVALAAETTLAIALFDLSATPEAESQGRYARQLASRAPAAAATIVMVDEAAFRRRFAGDGTRLPQRREAWRRFGEALGSVVAFVDLEAADFVAASRAVQVAMRSPVAAAPR